jgi:hypothetical protein
MSKAKDRLSWMSKSQLKAELRIAERALLLAFARAYPPGTIVARRLQGKGPRVVVAPPRESHDLGPVVTLVGLHDPGLNCSAVQLTDIEPWDGTPGAPT